MWITAVMRGDVAQVRGGRHPPRGRDRDDGWTPQSRSASSAMSVFVVIECDADDCTTHYDQGAPDKRTARRWARDDGWASAGENDYCPSHKTLAVRDGK